MNTPTPNEQGLPEQAIHEPATPYQAVGDQQSSIRPQTISSGTLAGRTAVVTGASSGMGRHTAQAMAAQGAMVLLAGRDPSGLQQTAEFIDMAGGHCLAVVTDVSDEASVEALINKALEKTGRLDIAFNAAGIFRSGPVDELSLDDFQAVFAANALGTWLCMKHQIRAMKQCSRGGTIVNVASNIGNHLARPGLGAYGASKAAVSALTKFAALEAISSHIRINSISPGPADTPMSMRPGEDRAARDARIATTNPSGRVATLDEIAQTVIWLCSESAGYVVGHDLVMDGGASL